MRGLVFAGAGVGVGVGTGVGVGAGVGVGVAAGAGVGAGVGVVAGAGVGVGVGASAGTNVGVGDGSGVSSISGGTVGGSVGGGLSFPPDTPTYSWCPFDIKKPLSGFHLRPVIATIKANAIKTMPMTASQIIILLSLSILFVSLIMIYTPKKSY